MGISQDTIFNRKDGIFITESNKGNIFVNFLVVTSEKINYYSILFLFTTNKYKKKR